MKLSFAVFMLTALVLGLSAMADENVKDFGAKGDGVTDDTAAIQAALNAAGKGGRVFIPPGIYKFSSLLLNNGQYIIGSGWYNARDAVNAFGDPNYQNGAYWGGTILRSTTTSESAIVHLGTGHYGGHIENLALIGPGSGTSVGIKIGSGDISIIKPIYQNVLIANFYTGTELSNVNEASFYDLTLRGCVTGLKFIAGVNNNSFYGPNFQRCTNGLVMETNSTQHYANSFISMICQNITGTGVIVRGGNHVFTNSYFELSNLTFDFDNAQYCLVYGIGSFSTQTLEIRSNSYFIQIHGVKGLAGALTINNAGYGSFFSGLVTGLVNTGGNTHIIDLNNATHTTPKIVTTHSTGPSIQFGATSMGARFGSNGPEIRSGATSPEGSITAPPGSIYLRSGGASGSSFYVKESGTGATGWIAK